MSLFDDPPKKDSQDFEELQDLLSLERVKRPPGVSFNECVRLGVRLTVCVTAFRAQGAILSYALLALCADGSAQAG